MSDEHAPMYSSTYGHPLVCTPNMDRLADMGVTFDNAYCNSPLCGPSRMSFMTGRYVHHIGCWDNASVLASDAVTWAHLLRAAGYDVVLSGKQHFCGPDQLHGFRSQLARDLHAEMWTQDGAPRGTPDWSRGIVAAKQPWGGLRRAGPGTTTEIEVDDLVEQETLGYLRDPRRKDSPWAIQAGFIAPHFPLVVPDRYWDMYPPEQIDLPHIPEGHLEGQHPVYRRMREAFGLDEYGEDLVRRGRAGYYGLIAYLDEKIGRLISVLEETGQLENTVIVHTSDHGEMNGEHGMWRKSNFYEASSRVPLQIAWPASLLSGSRVGAVVSLVDLTATILDIAGVSSPTPLDGHSLVPLMRGATAPWKDEAFCEYLAHGVLRPMAMLRRGQHKLNFSLGDDMELFDVCGDPGELTDLSGNPEQRARVEEMRRHLLEHWNPVELEHAVRRSQSARLIIESSRSPS